MRILLAALLVLLAGPPVLAAKPADSEAAALDAATAALCQRQVAVLGEAEHGDARTESFKIALIERLVSRCGYSAIVFEASFYEFAQLDRIRRSGQPITPEHVAMAVGGLWKYDREFQPLLPYLARQADAGKLRLGGVDFQQGGRDQDFSNFGVIAELTAELPPDRRDACRATFKARIYEGYTPTRRDEAATCLREMAAVPPSADRAVRRERSELLANLAAFAAVDPGQTNAYIASRDRAMFANFTRWTARWPAGTKVIVWTASAHAARAPHLHQGFAGVQPFGGYLARRYGHRMFALGFSAQGGTTRGRPQPRVIAAPAPDSLELWPGPLSSGGAVYLNRADLVRAGARPAGLFNHMPIKARWSELFDGVVIFGTEASARDIRQGQ